MYKTKHEGYYAICCTFKKVDSDSGIFTDEQGRNVSILAKGVFKKHDSVKFMAVYGTNEANHKLTEKNSNKLFFKGEKTEIEISFDHVSAIPAQLEIGLNYEVVFTATKEEKEAGNE